MDSLISAAARLLATGDPLAALNFVALRNDAPALALRGIAMAQLGDFARARALLKNAAKIFGAKEAVARARCIVAEAEVALASRNLRWPTNALIKARESLLAHGDSINAAHAKYLYARYLLLTGDLDAAADLIAESDADSLSPLQRALHELVTAGIAMRRVQAKVAHAALTRAANAAQQARIPALMAEVETTNLILNSPAARLLAQDEERLLLLDEMETLYASDALIIDACRLAIHHQGQAISLATRPVLFSLARALAHAWPNDVSRDRLIACAFRLKVTDESLRARLRVEVGRLRTLLQSVADVVATPEGFLLAPASANRVIVLAQPIEEKHANVLALLADGEAWSSSAIALALGISQRTVQRSLDALAAEKKVQAFGLGRAQRWLSSPVPGFTTILLLPHSLSAN